jgi:hypothetical protein
MLQNRMLTFMFMGEIHHLGAEDLEKYSMGTSSPEETARVEEHLLVCEGCQDRLRENDEYLLAVRMASQQTRRDEKSAKPRNWRFPAWFPSWLPALAAVACALLVVAVLTLRSGRPGPAVAVSLTALRSDGAGISAPSGRELLLRPDLTGLAESSSYRLEIVDQTGHPVRQGKIERSQKGIQIPGLGAGLYFVRVYLPAGEFLREYGLEVR